MESQVRTTCGITKVVRTGKRLDLSDGFDEVLVDGDKIGPVFVVDDHISQADEQPLFFVDGVGDAVPHRRNEKVAHIDAIHSADANANLLPLGHGPLLPPLRAGLAFTTKELLTPAQFFVLVLAHFLAAFFQHARHTTILLTGGSLDSLSRNCK